MKKICLVASVAVTALSLSLPAVADGKMHMKNKDDMHRMLHEMMDSNRDGSVDSREFQAFRDQHFSQADKNNDGNLSGEEFALMGKMMEEQRKKALEAARQKELQKHFSKMDANGDGKISKAEFDLKGEHRFIRMDSNDDGLLNREDRRGMGHHMEKPHAPR